MSLPVPAGSYTIDPVHSQLGFAVTHLGISIVRGTFDQFSGSLTVADDLEGTVVAIEAQMASVNSGSPARDEHLLGDSFFDATNHPVLSFRSNTVRESDAGYELLGDLTIRGISNPIRLAASYNGSAVFPMDQSTHFGFSATGEISRSAFGVSYGVPMVTDEVALHLEAQFVQPAEG
jgi:polyisoprenoid-binding protein YceI